MIFSKHFGFETTFVCYREKHVGLHSASWGEALYLCFETVLVGLKRS